MTAPRTAPPCGFCDGTGLWPDADAEPPVVDPCPLCNGSGAVALAERIDGPAGERLPLERILAALPHLAPEERQRLYEELYRRWDCRIYRG